MAEETMRLSFEYIAENSIEVKPHWTDDQNARYYWLPLSEWKAIIGQHGPTKLTNFCASYYPNLPK